MDFLISALRGLGPLVRFAAIVAIAFFLVFSDYKIFVNGQLDLFDNQVHISQRHLGYALFAWAALQPVIGLANFLGGRWIAFPTGLYTSSISYDDGILSRVCRGFEHPDFWQERGVICPVSGDLENWRNARIQSLELFDEKYGPAGIEKIYEKIANLRSRLTVYVAFHKIPFHWQAYSISGVGSILDRGDDSVIENLIRLDPDDFYNKIELSGPLTAFKLFTRGIYITLTCDQFVSAEATGNRRHINFYVVFKVRRLLFRNELYFYPGLAYTNGPGGEEVAVGYVDDHYIEH